MLTLISAQSFDSTPLWLLGVAAAVAWIVWGLGWILNRWWSGKDRP